MEWNGMESNRENGMQWNEMECTGMEWSIIKKRGENANKE